MRKVIFTAFLTFCMCMLLVACGNVNKEKESETPGVDSGVGGVENQKPGTSQENSGGNHVTTQPDNSSGDIIAEVDSEYANLKSSEGLEFKSNGDGTCTLTGIGICKDTVLVIPEKAPNGDLITRIEEWAFYNVKDLKEIIFAGRTMEVEEKAFQMCEFEKLVITGCNNLVIGENAFSYCDDITAIIISNSILTVEEYAFYDCGKDIEAIFLNSNVDIEKKAFQTSDIEILTITDCIVNIEENAFSYCDNITKVDFLNSEIYLDEYAFYDSGKKTELNVKGCIFSVEDKAFQASAFKNVVVENCTTKLGENAFSYCEDLESLSIGKGQTEIDSYAFYDCTELKNIDIGGQDTGDGNIVIIAEKAFQASGAENVSIHAEQVEIGRGAFSYCEELKSVEIGKGSLKVKKDAFYDCPDELVIMYGNTPYNKKSIEQVE